MAQGNNKAGRGAARPVMVATAAAARGKRPGRVVAGSNLRLALYGLATVVRLVRQDDTGELVALVQTQRHGALFVSLRHAAACSLDEGGDVAIAHDKNFARRGLSTPRNNVERGPLS